MYVFRYNGKLGRSVTINLENSYDEYRADLISTDIITPKVNKTQYKEVGKQGYKINTFSFGDSGLVLRFYVDGISINDARNNINKLIQQFSENETVSIRFADEPNVEYICVLDSYNVEYTGVDFYYLLTINVSAIKRGTSSSIQFGASTFSSNTEVECTFQNTGFVKSGLDIIVRFGGSDSFKVTYFIDGVANEVNLSNLSTSTFYYKIGGKKGEVLRGSSSTFSNATNEFLNSDVINFPVANVGENRVIFNQNTAGNIKSVMLEFYPLYYI